MPSRHVVFSHGKESGPWGSKIAAMADVARSEGYEADSVDYRGVEDPHDRTTRLLSYCRDLRGELVLVGSSLGGHVATSASSLLRARGLFLLAPALNLPGQPVPVPRQEDCPMTIVHGWHDEIVPVEESVRYAREHDAILHIIDADHRMQDRIPLINYLFEYFLVALDLPHRRRK